MAQVQAKANNGTVAATTAPVATMSYADKLAIITKGLNALPVKAESAAVRFTVDHVKTLGLDYHSMTSGTKASWTRKVKEMAKKAGISLED